MPKIMLVMIDCRNINPPPIILPFLSSPLFNLLFLAQLAAIASFPHDRGPPCQKIRFQKIFQFETVYQL